MGLLRRPDDDHQLHQRNRTPYLEHGHGNAEEEVVAVVADGDAVLVDDVLVDDDVGCCKCC